MDSSFSGNDKNGHPIGNPLEPFQCLRQRMRLVRTNDFVIANWLQILYVSDMHVKEKLELISLRCDLFLSVKGSSKSKYQKGLSLLARQPLSFLLVLL
jgi:hypothetical protein